MKAIRWVIGILIASTAFTACGPQGRKGFVAPAGMPAEPVPGPSAPPTVERPVPAGPSRKGLCHASPLEAEEYSALSSAIERFFGEGAERFHIRTDLDDADPSGLIATGGQHDRTWMATALRDFAFKRQQDGCVGWGFTLGVPYALVSREEIGRIFGDDGGAAGDAPGEGAGDADPQAPDGGPGWKRFRDRFGDDGVIGVTRVGFTDDGLRAVAAISKVSGPPAAVALWVELEKVTGIWFARSSTVL